MMKLKLRTKFLVSFLLVSSGLTCATLLIVHSRIKRQVDRELADDLRNSVLTFQEFHQQTSATRLRSVELLASQPKLQALMTTHDRTTIQDGSADLFRLSGGDLLMLADRSGRVAA